MRNRFPPVARALLPLLLILLAAACGGREGSEPAPSETEVRKSEPGSAPIPPVNRLVEERELRVEDLERKMSALERKIDEIRDSSREEGRSMKRRFQKRLKRLDRQRRLAGKRLQELKEAGGEAWDGVTILVEDTLERLEKAAEKAQSKLRGGE